MNSTVRAALNDITALDEVQSTLEKTDEELARIYDLTDDEASELREALEKLS